MGDGLAVVRRPLLRSMLELRGTTDVLLVVLLAWEPQTLLLELLLELLLTEQLRRAVVGDVVVDEEDEDEETVAPRLLFSLPMPLVFISEFKK